MTDRVLREGSQGNPFLQERVPLALPKELQIWEPPPPILAVLSGPSGVGKDAVLAALREMGAPFHLAITATTRPRRREEVDGREYFFLPEEEFLRRVRGGLFLEHALVYGHWYGVPLEQVKEPLALGKDTIVKTDVQGAATIKRKAPSAVFIFLAPGSMEELERRLRQRKSESPKALKARLETARAEMEQVGLFEYVVVNRAGALEKAVSQLEAILAAEKCRYPPRRVVL